MFEWLMDLANETLGFIDDSFCKLEMWIKETLMIKKGDIKMKKCKHELMELNHCATRGKLVMYSRCLNCDKTWKDGGKRYVRATYLNEGT